MQAGRYKMHILLDMLNDLIMYLYFHIVSPLVIEFDRVNTFFETDGDPEEMYTELSFQNKSLCACVLDLEGRPLLTEKVNFGRKFLFNATKYI